MRKPWLLVVVSACAPSFAPVATVAQLAVHRATGRWSNIYVLSRGDAAIAIDSGSSPDCEGLDAALAHEPKLRAVIVTHAHADHAGCARELQQRGAAIVLGAGDVATAARGSNDELRPTGLVAALLAPLFVFPFAPFVPDVAVEHEIDLGAYGFPEVHVAPAPGHTPGELVVLVGDTAFVGDMLKGGQVLAESPTEHLYQTDRTGDHAAIAALLGRPGLVALYPGHGGRLAAGDVRRWLADADDRGIAGALSIELDGRVELPGGATGGERTRVVLGGEVGYVVGLDVRAGYLDRGLAEADVEPIGIALRGQGGALITATGGVGLGGVRGIGATHAVGELAAELPLGGARLLARAALGWRLGGAHYASDAGIADEASALLGVRLFGDRRWGDYRAGHGPFVAATWSDLGGTQRYGFALGVELSSTH